MTKERDKALFASFKKTWSGNPHLTYDEAIAKTLNEPQPRLWVEFNCVYRILRRILYNSYPPTKRPSRSSLEGEIQRTYERLKKAPIFRECSPYFLAAFINAEPSHGFYISFEYAKRIIWKQRKLSRQQRK